MQSQPQCNSLSKIADPFAAAISHCMVEDLKPAMNNDHQREEQIFEAALQFPTPEQRAAFVKGAWGMMKRFANVSKRSTARGPLRQNPRFDHRNAGRNRETGR